MITRQIKPAIIAMAALLAIAGTADASQDAKIASVPALGGTVFTDDFSAGNGSWKYGNRECAPKDGALRLPFDHRILWATLSGRALHPGNLSEFLPIIQGLPQSPKQSYGLIHENGLALDFWAPRVGRFHPIKTNIKVAAA
jgi:hypothetical protein